MSLYKVSINETLKVMYNVTMNYGLFQLFTPNETCTIAQRGNAMLTNHFANNETRAVT